MKNIFYPAILFLFVLSSCGKEKHQYKKDTDGTAQVRVANDGFPELINLTSSADSIKIPPILLNVRKLIANEKLIIALEISNKDTLFRVFDSQNSKYLGGFGFIGPGPLDLEFAQVVPNGLSMKGDTLQVYDIKSLRTYFVDSEKMIRSSSVTSDMVRLIDKKVIPGALMVLNSPIRISESMIYGVKSNGKKHIVSYNSVNQEIKDTIEYPDFRQDIPPQALSMLYTSIFKFSEDRKKIAFAYRFFPVVRIFSFEKSEYLEVVFGAKNDQEKSIKIGPSGRDIDTRNMSTYYSNIEVSNELIFASYHEYIDEWRDDGTKETKWATKNREIHVYDWGGEPIKKLILPAHVLKYVPSPSGDKLYFVKPNVEGYIYRY